MSLIEYVAERGEHPVDVVERVAQVNEWTFERDGDDEISIAVTGGWARYDVAFTWLPDMEALHVACAFDLKVAELRRAEIQALVALINEQLWVGHFDLWRNENIVMFRHSLVLTGGAEPSSAQCEAVLGTAIEACERHYQAFQFVAWAGKSAREALDSVMFETVGEA